LPGMTWTGNKMSEHTIFENLPGIDKIREGYTFKARLETGEVINVIAEDFLTAIQEVRMVQAIENQEELYRVKTRALTLISLERVSGDRIKIYTGSPQK